MRSTSWPESSFLLSETSSSAAFREVRASVTALDSASGSLRVGARMPFSIRRSRRSRSFLSTQSRTAVGRYSSIL